MTTYEVIYKGYIVAKDFRTAQEKAEEFASTHKLKSRNIIAAIEHEME